MITTILHFDEAGSRPICCKSLNIEMTRWAHFIQESNNILLAEKEIVYFFMLVFKAIPTFAPDAEEACFGVAEIARIAFVSINPEQIPSAVMQSSLIFFPRWSFIRRKLRFVSTRGCPARCGVYTSFEKGSCRIVSGNPWRSTKWSIA